MEFA
jgi:hypothetical protein